MASIPTVVGVRQEKDGRFTATIHVLNGEEVKMRKEVTAATKNEFKEKIRPHLEAYLAKQVREEQLITAANQAIAELVTELGF